MNYLAIDTSRSSLTVVVGGKNKAVKFLPDCALTHSVVLMSEIENALAEAGIDKKDIDVFACAVGPGSFTGLRIGSATAKGLGLALKKPLVAVPTVEGLAYNLYDTPGLICPIMDARRRQVYTGIYCFTDHQLEVVEDQMAVPMETMIEKLNQRGETVTFLGDGVPVFRELIEEKMTVPYSFAPAHVNKQRAAAVAALGEIYYSQGKTETAMEHVPDYLRVSQAERERAEREAAKAGGNS